MAEFLKGTSGLDIGGNTIYNGVLFADIPELLGYFRDTAFAAGWTVVLDDIAANSLLKLKGTDPATSDECFINLSAVAVNATTFDLTIQGDVDGAGRTQNADTDEVSLTQRVKANSGRLYIGATARSLNFISVEKTPSIPSLPYYLGFPERKDTNDAGCWGYGILDWRMSNKFWAEPVATEGDWRELKEYFYTSTEAATLSNSSQGCYEGVIDRNTVFFFAPSSSNSASQSAYKPENGALGLDGKAKTDTAFLYRGQALQGNYAHVDDEGTAKIPYGDIDLSCVGMASLPAGDQVQVTSLEINEAETGVEYVRRTFVTGDLTTQGIQIFEERQGTPF